MIDERWCCTKCGGDDIHVAMWVSVNTNEVHDLVYSPAHHASQWCETCQEFVDLELKKFELKTESEIRRRIETLHEHGAELDQYPRLGWCGAEVDGKICGIPQFRTYGGSLCHNDHGGAPTLDEEPQQGEKV